MTHPAARRWDRRYAARPQGRSAAPDPFVLEFLPRLPRGRALDLAAGEGRHALLLARSGFRVDALDVSFVGLSRLLAAARDERLEVRCAVADLERWTPPLGAFDAVVVVDFLWRPLLDAIGKGLRPGAAVVVALPTVDRDPGERPIRREYLLERGELRSRLRSLDVALDREEGGRAHLLAFGPRGAREE
jgi:SAM-dependent methyltransferase